MKIAAPRSSLLPLILMAAGTVILIGIILGTVRLASSTADLSNRLAQARALRSSASEVLETLLNAETGQRGFLLTGDPQYLAPFERAQSTINRDLDTLDRLEKASPAMRPQLDRLRQLSDRKMAELMRTITLARTGHREDALALVRTNLGIQLMNEARGILARIILSSDGIVASNLVALTANANLLLITTLFGGALIVLFSVGSLWLVQRSLVASLRAREQVVDLNNELEERVQRRTVALTRSNEEIQRFAYIVSHDLRAPLVNIMGFTAEMEVATKTLGRYFTDETPDNQGDAKIAATQDLPEAAKFIRSSTGKMDRLINAILKLSREGRRELVAERVDLNQLFQTLSDSLKHQIEETHTSLDIAPKLPVLSSDRLAVEQVFGNLFDNALKYLQPGRDGHISVHAENARANIIISIKDNGRGIAENDHERVFDLFRRAGRQDKPGEGIGLAHVRALVRRMGGDITLVSQLGVGSEFRVLLPRSLPSEGSAS